MTDIQKQLAEALERCVNAIQDIGGEHVTDLCAALDAADDAQAILAAHRQQEARGQVTERWPAPQYDERQRQWCQHYEATTDFEPLMDDYEAGHETFVQAAQKSVQWYEDHTNDAYLAITRDEIPGSEFDHGIKGE